MGAGVGGVRGEERTREHEDTHAYTHTSIPIVSLCHNCAKLTLGVASSTVLSFSDDETSNSCPLSIDLWSPCQAPIVVLGLTGKLFSMAYATYRRGPPQSRTEAIDGRREKTGVRRHLVAKECACLLVQLFNTFCSLSLPMVLAPGARYRDQEAAIQCSAAYGQGGIMAASTKSAQGLGRPVGVECDVSAARSVPDNLRGFSPVGIAGVLAHSVTRYASCVSKRTSEVPVEDLASGLLPSPWLGDR